MLDDGELFGIYPEGTRSHDGRLYRGKTGVARLALETGVPVIPVAVVGHRRGRASRQEVRHASPGPIVRFGKPLDFSRYEGLENDRYILRSITDEIMYEIMRLSGQEYVDLYASVAKEEQQEGRRSDRRGGEGRSPASGPEPQRAGREGLLTRGRCRDRTLGAAAARPRAGHDVPRPRRCCGSWCC